MFVFCLETSLMGNLVKAKHYCKCNIEVHTTSQKKLRKYDLVLHIKLFSNLKKKKKNDLQLEVSIQFGATMLQYA